MPRVMEHLGGTLISDDGRNARRDRNREAVALAYIDLVRAGNLRPSVAEVAERSGVSYRSVFRYFTDQLDLAQTAIGLMYRRVPSLVPLRVGPDDELEARIAGLVDQRLGLYAEVCQVARLHRSLAVVHPDVQRSLSDVRQRFRQELADLFAHELDRLDADAAADLVAIIHLTTSFESLDLLLGDGVTSPGRVRRILCNAISHQIRADVSDLVEPAGVG